MENQCFLEVQIDKDHPEHPGHTVITAVGEIDVYTQPCLERHLGIVDTAEKGVIIDLRKITHLSCEGIGFLVRMFKLAKAKGKNFRVQIYKEGAVNRAINTMELHRFIPIDYHEINNN